MNENLNLIEILKDCPKGTKLYCVIMGEVALVAINNNDDKFPIVIEDKDGNSRICLTKHSHTISDGDGECILFPSKEVRTWEGFKPNKPKFDPNTLQPYDKVLIRDSGYDRWTCNIFSKIDNELECSCVCGGFAWRYCIPYNDDTKHLVGTKEEAPKYYRYWEE